MGRVKHIDENNPILNSIRQNVGKGLKTNRICYTNPDRPALDSWRQKTRNRQRRPDAKVLHTSGKDHANPSPQLPTSRRAAVPGPAFRPTRKRRAVLLPVVADADAVSPPTRGPPSLARGNLSRPVGCVDPREPAAGLGGLMLRFCWTGRIRYARVAVKPSRWRRGRAGGAAPCALPKPLPSAGCTCRYEPHMENHT